MLSFKIDEQNMKTELKKWNRKRNYALKTLKLKLKYFLPILVLNQIKAKQTIQDVSNIKKILVVRNDLIGDMVLSTPLLRNLFEHGYEVYVVSKAQALSMIENKDYVAGSFVYNDASWKHVFESIKNVRQHRFDLVIDMKLSSKTEHIWFCAWMKTPVLMGFNKSNVKAYNISHSYRNPEAHISRSFESIYTKLGIHAKPHAYDVSVPAAVRSHTQAFLQSAWPHQVDTNSKLIVLNPFGSKSDRWLSEAQIAVILAFFSAHKVVLIGEYAKISAITTPNHVKAFQSKGVLDITALIEMADCMVTVDTAIVHIASALQSKMIAFYKETPLMRPDAILNEDQQLKQSKYEFERLAQDYPNIRHNHQPLAKHVQFKMYAPNHPQAVQKVFTCHRIDAVSCEHLQQELGDAWQQLMQENHAV
ncbi:family 9 glycosyl transferase [Vitreoscilla sp. C1]|nr:family 9 glycosyl transferase [Vitreoscilla sp. C1]